jgi:hypothetical protein
MRRVITLEAAGRAADGAGAGSGAGTPLLLSEESSLLRCRALADVADLPIAGQLVTAADAGWDEARQAWDLAADQHPAAVAFVEGAHDVSEARRWRSPFSRRKRAPAGDTRT